MDLKVGDKLYYFNLYPASLDWNIVEGVVVAVETTEDGFPVYYELDRGCAVNTRIHCSCAYPSRKDAVRALKKEFSKQSRSAIDRQLTIISDAAAEIDRIRAAESRIKDFK